MLAGCEMLRGAVECEATWGWPLVHAYLGEPPKRLGLGMSGLGLLEPWRYWFASNTVPECQGVA